MSFDLKQQELARKQLSEDILDWSQSKKYILMTLPTGVGKTFNSLNISKKSSKPFLICVPEITLQKNFRDDAIKHGFGGLIEDADIICYASLGKYIDKEYSTVILDEAHRSTSDIRIDYLKNLKCERIIALSATVNQEIEEILNSVASFEKFNLSASEAISLGLLPEPEIKILELELDDKIVRNEFPYGKKKVKCTDRGYYQRLSDSITYWKDLYEDEKKPFQKTKMLSEGSKRQRFLGKCKTEKAKELLKIIGDERAIVFCSSVEQANELGSKLVVSNEKTKKQNQEIIQNFNLEKTNKIFSKSMLSEGQNLSSCKYGVIIQLNNQERDFIQRLGRCLRSTSPVLYILVIKNTVDERFLKNSIKNMNEEYITNQNT